MSGDEREAKTGTGAGESEPESERNEKRARGEKRGADDGTRIKQLDRRTIDRIAAGEVVERPASAVKELIENALDADASRVSVAVESGGIDGITVSDNGIGMSEGDVRRAVEKHTTSKIADIEDLERGVASLGFRGEALAAIGAVSELTVRTKPRGGTRGTELVVRGGEVESVSPIGTPAGTTIEVTDLFYNVPARKKYLKREATEFAYVNRIVTGYALANPDVAIGLEHGSRETFAMSASGDRREAVLATYGREVAAAMIPLGGRAEGDDEGNDGNDIDGESQVESIEGLISEPETTRANASYVTTIVNGRYVTATAIREAILDAYGDQLAPDRYPFAVVDIEVSPEAIDANVHPRKLEVRFEDERAVKEAIGEHVERALLDEGLIRSGAPRGRSAPTQARIEPEPGGAEPEEPEAREHEPTGTIPNDEGKRERGAEIRVGDESTSESPSARTDAETDDAPGSHEASASGAVGGGPTEDHEDEDSEGEGERASGGVGGGSVGEGERGGESERGTEHRAAGSGSSDDENGSVGSAEPIGPSSEGETRTAVDLEGAIDPHAHIDGGDARPSASDRSSTADRSSASRFSASEQRALSGDVVEDRRDFERLPSLRVLGQFDETYVVAETAEGLVLLDQHAADERVTYERLRERLPRGEAQTLAEPVELELTAGEAALFESAIDTLAGLGFYASWAEADGDEAETDGRTIGTGEGRNRREAGAEHDGTADGETRSAENGNGTNGRRTVQVRTVPAAISGCDPALLRDVLSGFVSAERPEATIDAAADALLADLACYPSITAGTSLSAGSMIDLLEALDACENPYACPHGRPVVIEFGRGEIEARFERDYPGHAGRRSE